MYQNYTFILDYEDYLGMKAVRIVMNDGVPDEADSYKVQYHDALQAALEQNY